MRSVVLAAYEKGTRASYVADEDAPVMSPLEAAVAAAHGYMPVTADINRDLVDLCRRGAFIAHMAFNIPAEALEHSGRGTFGGIQDPVYEDPSMGIAAYHTVRPPSGVAPPPRAPLPLTSLATLLDQLVLLSWSRSGHGREGGDDEAMLMDGTIAAPPIAWSELRNQALAASQIFRSTGSILEIVKRGLPVVFVETIRNKYEDGQVDDTFRGVPEDKIPDAICEAPRIYRLWVFITKEAVGANAEAEPRAEDRFQDPLPHGDRRQDPAGAFADVDLAMFGGADVDGVAPDGAVQPEVAPLLDAGDDPSVNDDGGGAGVFNPIPRFIYECVKRNAEYAYASRALTRDAAAAQNELDPKHPTNALTQAKDKIKTKENMTEMERARLQQKHIEERSWLNKWMRRQSKVAASSGELDSIALLRANGISAYVADYQHKYRMLHDDHGLTVPRGWEYAVLRALPSTRGVNHYDSSDRVFQADKSDVVGSLHAYVSSAVAPVYDHKNANAMPPAWTLDVAPPPETDSDLEGTEALRRVVHQSHAHGRRRRARAAAMEPSAAPAPARARRDDDEAEQEIRYADDTGVYADDMMVAPEQPDALPIRARRGGRRAWLNAVAPAAGILDAQTLEQERGTLAISAEDIMREQIERSVADAARVCVYSKHSNAMGAAAYETVKTAIGACADRIVCGRKWRNVCVPADSLAGRYDFALSTSQLYNSMDAMCLFADRSMNISQLDYAVYYDMAPSATLSDSAAATRALRRIHELAGTGAHLWSEAAVAAATLRDAAARCSARPDVFSAAVRRHCTTRRESVRFLARHVLGHESGEQQVQSFRGFPVLADVQLVMPTHALPWAFQHMPLPALVQDEPIVAESVAMIREDALAQASGARTGRVWSYETAYALARRALAGQRPEIYIDVERRRASLQLLAVYSADPLLASARVYSPSKYSEVLSATATSPDAATSIGTRVAIACRSATLYSFQDIVDEGKLSILVDEAKVCFDARVGRYSIVGAFTGQRPHLTMFCAPMRTPVRAHHRVELLGDAAHAAADVSGDIVKSEPAVAQTAYEKFMTNHSTPYNMMRRNRDLLKLVDNMFTGTPAGISTGVDLTKDSLLAVVGTECRRAVRRLFQTAFTCMMRTPAMLLSHPPSIRSVVDFFRSQPPEKTWPSLRLVLYKNVTAYAHVHIVYVHYIRWVFSIHGNVLLAPTLRSVTVAAGEFHEEEDFQQPNVILTGDPGTGKSVVLSAVTRAMLVNQKRDLTSVTAKAFNIEGIDDGRVSYMHEVGQAYLGTKEGAGRPQESADAERVNQYKNLFERGYVVTLAYNTSEKNKDSGTRTSQLHVYSMQGSTIWVSNLPIENMDPALRSRMIVIHVAPARGMTSLKTSVVGPAGAAEEAVAEEDVPVLATSLARAALERVGSPGTTEKSAALIDTYTAISAICQLIYVMRQVRAVPYPMTDVMETLVKKALPALLGNQAERGAHVRAMGHIRNTAVAENTLLIANVITSRPWSQHYRYAPGLQGQLMPFSFELLYEWAPRMSYITKEIVVMALTMLRDTFDQALPAAVQMALFKKMCPDGTTSAIQRTSYERRVEMTLPPELERYAIQQQPPPRQPHLFGFLHGDASNSEQDMPDRGGGGRGPRSKQNMYTIYNMNYVFLPIKTTGGMPMEKQLALLADSVQKALGTYSGTQILDVLRAMSRESVQTTPETDLNPIEPKGRGPPEDAGAAGAGHAPSTGPPRRGPASPPEIAPPPPAGALAAAAADRPTPHDPLGIRNDPMAFYQPRVTRPESSTLIAWLETGHNMRSLAVHVPTLLAQASPGHHNSTQKLNTYRAIETMLASHALERYPPHVFVALSRAYPHMKPSVDALRARLTADTAAARPEFSYITTFPASPLLLLQQREEWIRRNREDLLRQGVRVIPVPSQQHEVMDLIRVSRDPSRATTIVGNSSLRADNEAGAILAAGEMTQSARRGRPADADAAHARRLAVDLDYEAMALNARRILEDEHSINMIETLPIVSTLVSLGKARAIAGASVADGPTLDEYPEYPTDMLKERVNTILGTWMLERHVQ